MSSNYAQDLKKFADQLASDDNLSEEDIKKTMTDLNLVYTEDEIERLNRVLLALHPISRKIKEDTNPKQEISH